MSEGHFSGDRRRTVISRRSVWDGSLVATAPKQTACMWRKHARGVKNAGSICTPGLESRSKGEILVVNGSCEGGRL